MVTARQYVMIQDQNITGDSHPVINKSGSQTIKVRFGETDTVHEVAVMDILEPKKRYRVAHRKRSIASRVLKCMKDNDIFKLAPGIGVGCVVGGYVISRIVKRFSRPVDVVKFSPGSMVNTELYNHLALYTSFKVRSYELLVVVAARAAQWLRSEKHGISSNDLIKVFHDTVRAAMCVSETELACYNEVVLSGAHQKSRAFEIGALSSGKFDWISSPIKSLSNSFRCFLNGDGLLRKH